MFGAGQSFGIALRAGWLCLGLVCASFAAPAGAAELTLRCQGAPDRIALVVTNATYGGRLSDLPSTAEDGRIIADALCAQRFTVRQIRDADLTTLRGALATFQQDVQDAPRKAIGFFYYSGHGAQSTLIGESYLIPARAPIERRAQLSVQAIGIGEVLRGVRAAAAGASKNVFVVLDACRDVAFPGETMSTAEKGIGAVPKQEGLFIAYSTRPGETAKANNVFSSALARNLAIAGKGAYDIFFDTRRDVFTQTQQFPWFEDGLLERVVLKPAAAATASAEPSAAPFDVRSADTTYWQGCCASAGTTSADLEAYLAKVRAGQFPGLFRDLAERRLASLRSPPPTVQASVPAPQAQSPSPPAPARIARVIEPEMVRVPGGTFVMGSPSSEPGRFENEGPQQSITIAAFEVGKYEVTFDEWDACVAGGGCNNYRPADQGWGRGRRPAINVSWDDAKAYVNWLNGQTGKRYRLLTEAEWEYATRAGTTTPFWWGASITSGQANYDATYTYNGGPKGEYRQQTLPVGSFQANGFGLYDVHGNVWEWVEDCYRDNLSGQTAAAYASGGCSSRVLRGGSWHDLPQNLRSAYRDGGTPAFRFINFGFRLARTVSPSDR